MLFHKMIFYRELPHRTFLRCGELAEANCFSVASFACGNLCLLLEKSFRLIE